MNDPKIIQDEIQKMFEDRMKNCFIETKIKQDFRGVLFEVNVCSDAFGNNLKKVITIKNIIWESGLDQKNYIDSLVDDIVNDFGYMLFIKETSNE